MPLSKEQAAIIAKLQDGLDLPYEEVERLANSPVATIGCAVGPVPLSINERVLVIETLRWAWLARPEWKAYRRWRELEDYEATKRLAQYGVPYGQREDWIQAFYGKSKRTLIRYFTRIRTGR